MKPGIIKESIIIDGRYRLTRYAELAPGPEDKRNLRLISYLDLKTKEEIELEDTNRDGLDKVLSGISHLKTLEITPHYRNLYQKTQDIVAKRLSDYIETYYKLVRSQKIDRVRLQSYFSEEKKYQGINYELFATGIYFYLRAFLFFHEGAEFPASLRIEAKESDGETIYAFSAPEMIEGPLRGIFTYLKPLLELSAQENVAPYYGYDYVWDGKWISFLYSDHFNTFYNKDLRFIQLARQVGLGDEAALYLLENYQGKPDFKSFEAYLDSEKKSYRAIWRKGERADRTGTAVLLEQFFRDAIVQLLQGDSPIKLRESSFQYLNDCLVLKEEKVYLMDRKQTQGETLPLPFLDLLSLVADQSSNRPSFHLDGYCLHDLNQDGKIDNNRDLLHKKISVGDHCTVHLSNAKEMLADLTKRAFPPFDTQLFFENGVPFEALNAWAEVLSPQTIIQRRVSKNPMDDGDYRLFIHRESQKNFSLDKASRLLRAFIQWNQFDDIYTVPHAWGLEMALNEIADRNLPIKFLYIGTHHGLEKELLQLNFDKGLIFAKGAEVIFTGCDTSFLDVLRLGSQLFRNFSGTIIWSDSTNLPLPYGNFLPLNPEGYHYETSFHNGVATETKKHYFVDPIPSGSF